MSPIRIFCATFSNEFATDQQLVFEAADCVSALMKAQDFLNELDRRTAEKLGDADQMPSIITGINGTESVWMDEEGMDELLDAVVMYEED